MKNGVFSYKEAWVFASAKGAPCSNSRPRAPNAKPILRKELATGDGLLRRSCRNILFVPTFLPITTFSVAVIVLY